MIITRENCREILTKLSEPFPADAIEWRIGTVNTSDDGVVTSALAFAYINRTAAQDRLDSVLGPENWCCEYVELQGGKGQLCGLGIRIDGEWITKWDGADNTDMEAVKGGLSGAFKRAFSVWGGARYLYNLDKGFVILVDRDGKPLDAQRHGSRSLKAQHGRPLYASGQDRRKREYKFYWYPPTLPDWALPGNTQAPTPTYQPAEPVVEEPAAETALEVSVPVEGDIDAAKVKEIDDHLLYLRDRSCPKGDYRILYDTIRRDKSINDETRSLLLSMIKGAVEQNFPAEQQAA